MDVFKYHPDALIPLKDIVGKDGVIGVSQSTWYRGVREGRYPKPVKISKQRRAWRAGDLQAYLQSLNGSAPSVS